MRDERTLRELHDELEGEDGIVAFLSDEAKALFTNELSSDDPVQARMMELWDDEIMSLAKLFISVNPIFYDPRERWYAWNFLKQAYVHLDELDVIRLFDRAVKPLKEEFEQQLVDANRDDDKKRAKRLQKRLSLMNVTNDSRRALLYALKVSARTRYYTLIRPKWQEVQCGSKLINLKDGTEQKVSPAFLVKNPIPWEPKKGDYSRITNIFKNWVDDEDVVMLEELTAFCMVPKYFIKKIIWLLGGGNNGKSSFLRFLTNVLGTDNVTSSDLTLLEKERFETSTLLDKLLCVINEVDHKTIWQNRMAKAISGGDEIRIEEKNKPVTKAIVYSKLIIAANQLPRRTDYSQANMSRFVGVRFPYQFDQDGENPVDGLTPEEYSAFVYHIVYDVLQPLVKNRKLSVEKPVDVKEVEYDQMSDSLHAFISERVDDNNAGEDDYIPRQQFYSAYEEYCRSNGLRYETFRKTNGRMENEFGWRVGQPRTDDVNGSGRVRAWMGIAWLPSAKPESVQTAVPVASVVPAHIVQDLDSEIVKWVKLNGTVTEADLEYHWGMKGKDRLDDLLGTGKLVLQDGRRISKNDN